MLLNFKMLVIKKKKKACLTCKNKQKQVKRILILGYAEWGAKV